VHKEIPVIVPPKPNTTAVPTRTSNEQVEVTNDKCFRCRERWVPGHRFQCKMNKQVRAMLTKEEEDWMNLVLKQNWKSKKYSHHKSQLMLSKGSLLEIAHPCSKS
jgi:hypothetical protein